MERADVIVIGGGVLGCAAALHLTEAGADTLLLERDGLAQATSNAGAGFVAVWAAGHVHDAWGSEEADLERYALDFYRDLDTQGHDIGWHQNGVMWAVTTEAAFAEHLAPYANHPEAPTARVIDGDEVAALTGVVDAAGVHGAVFQPDAARISAPKATRAIAARFAANGGRLDLRRPVTGLRLDGGRVVGVDTTRGPVAADAVVLAAGAWTNTLIRPYAHRLPMVPLVAARVITEPVGAPATMPPILFPEFAHLWVREEAGGLLFGASFENVPRYALVDRELPERFDGLPLDGVAAAQREAIAASVAIPAFARYRSSTVAHGAPQYTPDLRGVVGRVPGLDGAWVVGGCNEAGITHGPGYGRLIAELVTNRSLTVAAEPFRPDRFGAFDDDAAVVAAMADRGRMSWVDVTGA